MVDKITMSGRESWGHCLSSYITTLSYYIYCQSSPKCCRLLCSPQLELSLYMVYVCVRAASTRHHLSHSNKKEITPFNSCAATLAPISWQESDNIALQHMHLVYWKNFYFFFVLEKNRMHVCKSHGKIYFVSLGLCPCYTLKAKEIDLCFCA